MIDTPAEVSDLFLWTVNECVDGVGPDRSDDLFDITQDGDGDISEEHIEITNKWAEEELLHIKYFADHLKIGVNWNIWEDLATETKIVAVIHQTTHFRETGHSEEFYTEMVETWKCFRDQYDEQQIVRDINWNFLRNRIILDGERHGCTRVVEESTGYQSEWVKTLDGNRIEISLDWEPSSWISVDQTKIPEFDDEELYSHYESLEHGSYTVWIPEIHGELDKTKIEITDGEVTAALLKRNGHDEIPVKL